jgi:hypothetical protein
MKKHVGAYAFLTLALIPTFTEHAFATAAGGIDTPAGVSTLPLQVEGQTAITITNTDALATPPTTAGVAVNFPLTTTGNVGLGTTSPQYLLDTGAASGFVHFTNNTQSYPASSGAGGLAIGWNYSSGNAEVNFYNVYNNATTAYQFSQKTGATTSSNLMTIMGNGNVGIGTSSPNGARLQVDGVANSYTALYLEGTGTGNIPQYLQFGKNGTKYWDVAGGGLDNNLYIQNIPFESGSAHNAGNIVTFNSDGNVGFGTDNPYAQVTLSSELFGTYLGLENTAVGGDRWDLVSLGSPIPAPLQPGSFAIQNQDGYIPFIIGPRIGPVATQTRNIGINNVNPAYALDVNGTVSASNKVVVADLVFIDGSAGGAVTIGNATNGVWLNATQGINVNNQISLTTAGSATFKGYVWFMGGSSASDMRLKKDIQPLAVEGLDVVTKLKPVTFQWKNPKDENMKGEQIGFIAQDVKNIVPSLVLTSDDADKTLSLKYDQIIPILTKAIQEQQTEIAAQRTEIDALKKDVVALKRH